jgi:hypothetical protein
MPVLTKKQPMNRMEKTIVPAAVATGLMLAVLRD